MSRKGIEYGSVTLHPDGIPHGPHPGRTEASLGATRTDELAVMVDTFKPFHVSRQALGVEDDEYYHSWLRKCKLEWTVLSARASDLASHGVATCEAMMAQTRSVSKMIASPCPINETHDPALRSWVTSANTPGADFPIQNLPFGVFRRALTPEPPRVGVAIGDQVLDLRRCHRGGTLRRRPAVGGRGVRRRVAQPADGAGRRTPGPHLAAPRQRAAARGSPALVAEGRRAVPRADGRSGDWRCRRRSATTRTSTRRSSTRRTSAACSGPTSRCCPNYKYVPIGYHGRASSIVTSGTPVRRPQGRSKPESAPEPSLRPSAAARLRAGGRGLRRRRERARRADPRRRGRAAPVRRCAC